MPGISFKARFAPAVENGLALLAHKPLPHRGIDPKFQTIRKRRKHEILNGDLLKLWQQQRSPERRKLGDSVCTLIIPLEIHWTGVRWRNVIDRWCWIRGRPALDTFAQRDGLDEWDDMRWFFRLEHEMPCRNLVLIGWGGAWDPVL